MTTWTAVPSPNAPRPSDPLTVEIADMLRRIERNYERETSGPGSRFEGRLLEDVQAEAVLRRVRESIDAGLPERITDALTRIEVRMKLDGPMAHKIVADDLAAAIVKVMREDSP